MTSWPSFISMGSYTNAVRRLLVIAVLLTGTPGTTGTPGAPGTTGTPGTTGSFQIASEFEIELVAGPPLVLHPMLVGFDDRGRLFVSENAGVNLDKAGLNAQAPSAI